MFTYNRQHLFNHGRNICMPVWLGYLWQRQTTAGRVLYDCQNNTSMICVSVNPAASDACFCKSMSFSTFIFSLDLTQFDFVFAVHGEFLFLPDRLTVIPAFPVDLYIQSGILKQGTASFKPIPTIWNQAHKLFCVHWLSSGSGFHTNPVCIRIFRLLHWDLIPE